MQEIVIESSGRRLAARIFAPDAEVLPRPAVLFLHGLNSSQSGYAPRAQRLVDELGATCLTLDLGGHGASDGDLGALTPHDNLRDVLAAYDRLAAEPGVTQERIGACGASYGAYLASLLVSKRPVARLLLRAPALFDDGLFDVPLARRHAPGGHRSAENMLAGLNAYAGEVMVVEGEEDAVVTRDTIETYLASIRHASHRVIPGATHSLSRPEWREAFLDIIVEWFRGI